MSCDSALHDETRNLERLVGALGDVPPPGMTALPWVRAVSELGIAAAGVAAANQAQLSPPASIEPPIARIEREFADRVEPQAGE